MLLSDVLGERAWPYPFCERLHEGNEAVKFPINSYFYTVNFLKTLPMFRSSRKFSMKHALVLLSLAALVAFKGEKDPLHKRVFNISLDEVKDGQPKGKIIADKMYFKDGKLFTDYMYDKFGYKYIRYRINKDSVYTDSTDTEVSLLEVEASATDEDNQTIMINFTQVEWDIDGNIKITKNDKLKRYFDFVGREKGGKPKKPKNKDKKKLIEVQKPGSATETNTLAVPPPEKK